MEKPNNAGDGVKTVAFFLPRLDADMILIRVYRGMADHFPIRRSEWVMMGATFAMCGVLYITPNMFAESTSFRPLLDWGDEQFWLTILLAVGVFRLVALVVNGTFKQFRYSPFIRMAAAGFSLYFWSQWTWGIIVSYFSGIGIPSGIVAYGTFCLFELLNLKQASEDVGGEWRRVRKNQE